MTYFGPTPIKQFFGYYGIPTTEGLAPFRGGASTQQEVFGDAYIPINVPGRSGIAIHARFPDSPNGLKGTVGCVRVHNGDVNDLANFIEEKCNNEPNTFIKR